MLGYRVWAARYDGERAIIGQTVRVNGTPAVVIGVMPARFGFPLTAEVWQPLAQMAELRDRSPDTRVEWTGQTDRRDNDRPSAI